jgi:hypothetical protein
MIGIIEREPNGFREAWSYSSVKERGATVTVQRITPSLKQWEIDAEGNVTELPTRSSGL